IVKEKHALRKEQGQASFLVDIGDHMDRVHPITEATLGHVNVTLLNDLDYDVVTIGNNEGITLSHKQLFHLYDDANFAVVCSNIKSLTKQTPRWLREKFTLQTASGVNIGFLGVTAAFNPYYHQLDWHVDDPFATIRSALQNWKEEVDIIVLLSHIGIYDDQRMA